jgi:hypothetical protein
MGNEGYILLYREFLYFDWLTSVSAREVRILFVETKRKVSSKVSPNGQQPTNQPSTKPTNQSKNNFVGPRSKEWHS